MNGQTNERWFALLKILSEPKTMHHTLSLEDGQFRFSLDFPSNLLFFFIVFRYQSEEN